MAESDLVSSVELDMFWLDPISRSQAALGYHHLCLRQMRQGTTLRHSIAKQIYSMVEIQ